MFINIIDEFIDNIIQNYFSNIKSIEKLNNKKIDDIYKSISEIIKSYLSKYDFNKVEKFLVKQEYVDNIKNIINKYLYFYSILIIGYFISFKSKKEEEEYIQNIVELQKYNTIFNPNNISILNNFYKLIKKIIYIINLKSFENINIDEYKDTIEFLNIFGQDYVMQNFKGEKLISGHNIVATIIIYQLYRITEKKEIFKILENKDKEDGEYMYINVVYSVKKTLDFNSIENIYDDKTKAKEMYNFINTHINNLYQQKELFNDEKINILIQNKILIPIVDDFLRYHKDSEKYEKDTDNKKDTKIKYIVNKLNKVADLYSDPKKADKFMYVPLANRKAILINDFEEVNILNKIQNSGVNSIKTNEFYEDLISYRMYPYVNFNIFKKYGIKYLNEKKTIDIVRSVTFEQKNNIIQKRICSKNMLLNIVGFMINTSNKNLECLKNINIKNITKNKLNNVIKLINNYIIESNKTNKSFYFLFNPEYDKIKLDKYQEINNIDPTYEETIKLFISKIYDDILILLYNNVKLKIKSKKMNMKRAHKYIKKINNFIPYNTFIYNELDKIIYEQYKRVKYEYDKNEDKIISNKKTIKLPSVKFSKKEKITTLYLKKKEEKIEKKNIQLENVICQHNIDWINVKKNVNNFTENIYKFVEKYAIEEKNSTDIFCKSCGIMLSVKKYIFHGYYDRNDGKYKPLNLQEDSRWQTSKKYENYNLVIKNLDKNIDKICNISNIAGYIGSSSNAVNQRSSVIKNVIDLILLHNKFLRKIYTSRLEKINKNYGLNRTFSKLFFFELESSIFLYSSEETDKFKGIKFNNIIVYSLLFIILELNTNQIVNLKLDKICNYENFMKIESRLFNNLKIIINTNNKTNNINNYSVLCYCIYYFSCIISKYKLWFSEDDRQTFIQISCLQTIIDTLNSILEIDINKVENNFIYKIFKNKFFIKLESDYSNLDTFKILKNKLKVHEKQFIKKSNNNVNMIKTPEFTYFKHKHIYHNFNQNDFFSNLSKNKKINNINILSSITNCNDGQFHHWNINSGKLQCSKCKVLYSDIDLKKSNYNTILRNYITLTLSKKYNKNLSYDDLIKLDNQKKKQKETIYKHFLTKESVKEEKIHKLPENNNIDLFIKNIEKNIGFNVNINGENVYTNKNIYIINYDLYGNELKKEHIFTESNVKIIKNHSFFKKDVYHFVYNQNFNYFFNMYSLEYIGFKLYTQPFEFFNKKRLFLKINYSIEKKLSLLGYDTKYIIYNNTNKNIFVQQISENRIQKLKNIIYNINKIFSQLKNNKDFFTIYKQFKERKIQSNFLNILKQPFKQNNYNNIFYKTDNKINIDIIHDKYINAEDIIKNDKNGNSILYYIIEQLNNIININTDSLTKTNITFFILDLINYMYNQNTINNQLTNINMIKFKKIVDNEQIITDTTQELYGFYNEYIDEENKEAMTEIEQDAQESLDAIDIDEAFSDEDDDYISEQLYSPDNIEEIK